MGKITEKGLLKNLASGKLDGIVGDDLTTSGGSSVWMAINGGIPRQFKQGPSRKFFNGRENERIEGKLHILQEWATDDEKLQFLQKFGWLMKDKDVKDYSALFKPSKRVCLHVF